jgi:hypothetical protein
MFILRDEGLLSAAREAVMLSPEGGGVKEASI